MYGEDGVVASIGVCGTPGPGSIPGLCPIFHMKAFEYLQVAKDIEKYTNTGLEWKVKSEGLQRRAEELRKQIPNISAALAEKAERRNLSEEEQDLAWEYFSKEFFAYIRIALGEIGNAEKTREKKYIQLARGIGRAAVAEYNRLRKILPDRRELHRGMPIRRAERMVRDLFETAHLLEEFGPYYDEIAIYHWDMKECLDQNNYERVADDLREISARLRRFPVDPEIRELMAGIEQYL